MRLVGHFHEKPNNINGHWGKWCPGAESNHRHCDFQSHALPTELPGRRGPPKGRAKQSARFIEAGFRAVQTNRMVLGKRSKRKLQGQPLWSSAELNPPPGPCPAR